MTKQKVNFIIDDLEGVYDPLTGSTSRKCGNIKCERIFQGHGNRRYCCEQCKRQTEVSRRAPRNAERNYVHPRAKIYSENVRILDQLLKVSSDPRKCSINAEQLIALGFDDMSPSDQVGQANIDFICDSLSRFGDNIVCYHGDNKSYTIVKYSRRSLTKQT